MNRVQDVIIAVADKRFAYLLFKVMLQEWLKNLVVSVCRMFNKQARNQTSQILKY